MPSKVDDFWAQLKSSNAPKKKVADTTARVGSVRKQQHEDRLTNTSGKETKHEAHAAFLQEPQRATAHQGSREHEEPACSCAFNEDHFRQRAQQLAEAFRSENSGTRRQALSGAKALVLGSSQVPAPPEAVLTDVVEQHLGKALLRRFDDQSEGCRELAAITFLGALHAAPQAVLALLPYAVPVLEERLCFQANKSPKEPSEEVRLVLAQIVVVLIRLGGKAISAYAAEVVGFVVVMSEDPFHEVAMQACAAVVELNACLGMRLHSVSKQFVAQLLPLTTHKRHTVRIAALQAIKVIMHQNAHEMILEMIAWRDPNMIPIKAFYGDDLKVNFAGKLATDPHPMVRLEFLRTISDWMLNLRERVDHEPRLLPYALSALNDSCPQVVEEALVLLDKLGEQYEKDHANDLKDTVYYLPHEAHGLGWQSVLQEEAAVAKGKAATSSPQGGLPCSKNGTISGKEEGNQEQHQLASFAFVSSHQAVTRTEGSAGTRELFVMPGPFVSRPRLGTRILVQAQFSRSMHPLLAEVGSWQQEPKLKAALLLRTLLVLGEDPLHQYLQHLVPAFCKAIQDPEVSPIIRDCIAIVACYVPPTMILELLGPRIADGCEDLRSRAAALEVLAHVVRGAGARGAVDSVLEDLVDLVDGSDALLRSEDVAVQDAVAHLVHYIIVTCGPACTLEQERLLWLLLHLEAAKASNFGHLSSPACSSLASATTNSAAASPPHVSHLCALLAEATGHASVDHMVAHFRAGLLHRCVPSACVSMALEARVLARLLLTFGDATEEGSLLAAGREGAGSGGWPQLSTLIRRPGAPSSSDKDGQPGQRKEHLSPSGLPTAEPLWSAHSLDAALDRLLSQVPLLAHHAPSAATCLPCLCSLLLHLPYMGISSQSAGVGTASASSVPRLEGASSGRDDSPDVEISAAGSDMGSDGTGRAVRCRAAGVDTGPEGGSGPDSGQGVEKQSAAVLLSREQGGKLVELLALLVEQVGDGVPLVWALRCLLQACSTAPCSSAPATTTPCSSAPGSAIAHLHSSSDTHSSSTLHSCIGVHSTASREAGTLILPPSLLWQLLPRLSRALCQRSLRSASPTVRVQGCRATAQLLEILCRSDLGGDQEAQKTLLSALQYGQNPEDQEKSDTASSPCQEVLRDGSSHPPAEGTAIYEEVDSNASGDVEAGGGLKGLVPSMQQLSTALLSLMHGDARQDVMQASLASLQALMHCFQRLHQHCQGKQAADHWVVPAADVLRQVMSMQQGDDPLLAGLAQKVVSDFESWPEAFQIARDFE